MLQSKYLTQEGVTGFLRMIYDKGYNFVFRNPDKCEYTLSKHEPVFRGNTFLRCDGDHKYIKDDFSIDILKDLLNGRNYIKIDEHIDVVDWSQVPVDTPILVSNDNEHWYRRYFARVANDRIETWIYGATSWSVDDTDTETYCWRYAKLAE
nr:MAG TPA: hypothetical protein [Caudoviricetes sp.]